tara:strand:+ start:1517 stop:1960 length:444 start_codon:yes stop_codon:yes gene_type:complete
MAHFAELDDNNVVLRVVVVGNDCVPSDEHIDGEKWCISFFKGGVWKQTSYNHNFRKQYAGRGFTFDSAKNKFISPQPHASWALDVNDDWQAPVTYPTDTTEKTISWDEENLRWTARDNEGVYAEDGTETTPPNYFNWDASALAWVSA